MFSLPNFRKTQLTLFITSVLLLSACANESDPHALFDHGDYDKAYAAFLQRADIGDLDAYNFLGIMHYLGLGRRHDMDVAFQWFEKAAVKGYPSAQFNLGAMYENGESVSRDVTKAYMWFYAAKEQGHEKAALRMQLMLNDHKLFPNQATAAVEAAKPYIIDRVETATKKEKISVYSR